MRSGVTPDRTAQQWGSKEGMRTMPSSFLVLWFRFLGRQISVVISIVNLH
jgi:hypothetical protein